MMSNKKLCQIKCDYSIMHFVLTIYFIRTLVVFAFLRFVPLGARKAEYH